MLYKVFAHDIQEDDSSNDRFLGTCDADTLSGALDLYESWLEETEEAVAYAFGDETKAKLVSELKELFGDMDGPVRLHWSQSEQEAEEYPSLDSALEDVAEEAFRHNQTAKEIEEVAYIVTETEYQLQEEEARIQSDWDA